MIPVLLDAGLRVVAPDLVGFGRSDKPVERSDYPYARHVAWMRAVLLEGLALRDVTFVGQDWGGLVGFSDSDPITRGGEWAFHKRVPGAAGRHHVTLTGGGHFLQEDVGPQFAKVVADFVAGTAHG